MFISSLIAPLTQKVNCSVKDGGNLILEQHLLLSNFLFIIKGINIIGKNLNHNHIKLPSLSPYTFHCHLVLLYILISVPLIGYID